MIIRIKFTNSFMLLAIVFSASGCKAPYWKVAASSPPKQADALAPLTQADPSLIETVAFALDSDLPLVEPIAVESATASRAEHEQPEMALEDFEALAYTNHPALRELAAITQKAAGFRTQVGLRGNPIVGYQGTQLADQGTDQHTAFVQQEIVTGGKLGLNRRVLDETVRAQRLELEAQKYRVATDIKIKFYEALAAQRRIELIEEFQTVTNKGLELAESLKKAAEGSQLEVLQAQVQKNEIDLSLQQAEINFVAAWRELTALAGSPPLATGRLRGELPSSSEALDWNNVSANVLISSPEYSASQVRVNQALANLQRQDVQPLPNVTVQVAGGIDNGTDSGLLNLQVGAPIPIFNKNQGNIAAARAEYCRAQMEVLRIENSIKARVAVVSNEYDSSLAAVKKYAADILPNAKESLRLAEQAYTAGETSFIQVLVARRVYFDSNLKYIAAQTQLVQAQSKVDGFVLTGGLDAMNDRSGDDSLRDQTFNQQ